MANLTFALCLFDENDRLKARKDLEVEWKKSDEDALREVFSVDVRSEISMMLEDVVKECISAKVLKDLIDEGDPE
jgi:gamma-glutamylcysteine synthetase